MIARIMRAAVSATPSAQRADRADAWLLRYIAR